MSFKRLGWLLGCWQAGVALVLAVLVGVFTLYRGNSLFGDPRTDFLSATAIGAAFLMGWAYFRKHAPPSVRTANFIAGLTIAVGGAVIADVDLLKDFRLMFRGRGQSQASFVAPPPRTYDYAAPKSSRTVDLTAVTPFDWPSYRGLKSNGRAFGAGLGRNWKKHKPVRRWSHPLGGGVSAPIVVGEFVINHEQRGKNEVVACYELANGKECWTHSDEAAYYEPNAGTGPRATPASSEGLVVSLGGTGLLNCLNGNTGELRWQVKLLAEGVEPPHYGLVASPVVANRAVIVSRGVTGPSLAAFAIRSGKLLWESDGPPPAYATPLFFDDGRTGELWVFHTAGLDARDAQTGKSRWQIPWKYTYAEKNNICQPIPLAIEGKPAVFLSTGYDVGCAAFRIPKLGDSNDHSEPKQLWRNKSLCSKYGSAVEIDGLIYGLDDSLLVCLDSQTGTRKWKHPRRFNDGQIVAAENMLLIQNGDGMLTLGEASADKFTEFGSFDSEMGRGWNVPALAGRFLVMRTTDQICCIELPIETAKP